MSVDLRTVSVAQWFDEVELHRCGYCKSAKGSVSVGMICESLTVDEYQDLIDRGWRRSGKYCYKPTMDKTCCPQYTIRCDVSKFSLNKSHKKIVKKFNKFLSDGIVNKSNSENFNAEEGAICDYPQHSKQKASQIDLSNIDVNDSSNEIHDAKDGESSKNIEVSGPQIKRVASQTSVEGMVIGSPNLKEESSNTCSKSKAICKPGLGADPTKPPCKKAKLLRMERKNQKLSQKSSNENVHDAQRITDKSKNNVQKSLSQFLEDVPSSGKHKLKLTIVPTSYESEEWEQTKDTEYQLYKKYQMIVHGDPDEKLSMSSFCRFLVSSPLKVKIVQMSLKDPSFNYAVYLYRKYQLNIHNDSVTDSDFIEHLINSPLEPKEFPNNVEGCGYGSFHQQYWLDDKLIAVGVIDVLPSCISSVYFFYDPDYRDLTLGTYGSLREIQLIQSLSSKLPELHYYYMGFYIHSCPKMRYKGKLVPSDLLCPETYVWVPIELCLPKLDVSKYARLNEDPNAEDDNVCSLADFKKIKVIHSFKLMTSNEYIRYFDGQMETFENLGKLLGKKSSSRIIFWMD